MQKLNVMLTAPRILAISLSGGVFTACCQQLLEGQSLLNDTLHIPLLAGAMVTALALMTLMTRVVFFRAALPALTLGVIAGLLLWIGGVGNPLEFLRRDVSAGALVAFTLVAPVPLPFVQSLCLGQGLRYQPIFEASLQIVLAWGTGVIFTLLSWATILLAGELLELVGLPVVEALMRGPYVPAALTGVLLGLGCAIFAALPFGQGRVPLLLTRLLAPPFVLVQALFLIALPLHGLSALDLSPTLLMGSAVLFAALLLSVIAGPAGQLPTGNRFWQGITVALAVLMLPMAGVALWSVGVRIATYGVTPPRLGGMSLALIGALMALGYGLSLLRHKGYLSVALTNMIAAGVLLGFSISLLSGLAGPEAISVRSQLARLERGEATLDELPLYSMANSWGPAGRQGLEDLRTRYVGNTEALARLDQITHSSRPALSVPPTPEETAQKLTILRNLQDQLARSLPLLQAEKANAQTLTPEEFARDLDMGPDALRALIKACETLTPQGHAGCLAIAADFLTDQTGDEIMLLSLQPAAGPNGRVTGWRRHGEQALWRPSPLIGDLYLYDASAAIDQIHRDGPRFRPVLMQSLTLENQDLFFRP